MSKPVIVFDVDSTLLDFVTGFTTWMTTQGHPPHDEPHEKVKDHQSMFLDLYPALGHEGGKTHFGYYGNHDDFSAMPFMVGVEASLMQLRHRYPSCRLYAVSSMGQDPVAVAARKRNLAALPLDDFTALEFGQLKVDKLRELNAQLFFDDHPDQIAAAEAAHIPAVLVHQPWNRSHSVRYRLNHWGEAPDLAAQLLEKAGIAT